MSRFDNHVRSDAKKWVAIIIAVILLAVAVMAACTRGFTDWDPWNWFGTKDNPEQTEQTEENTSGSILGEGVTYGVRAVSAPIADTDYAEYGVSTLAETAYSLTATAYDEDNSSDGIPQNFTYTATWQNPSSEWASGKDVDDYYTVTSTGINTATASCLQAFGEPIIITATSDFNDNAYCTWQADYVARVNSVEVDLSASTWQWDEDIGKPVSINYGTGTVKGYLSITNYSTEFSSDFVSVLITNNSYYSRFIDQAEDLDISVDFDLTSPTYNTVVHYTEEDDTLNDDLALAGALLSWFYSNMDSGDVVALRDGTNNFEFFKYALAYAGAQCTDDFNIWMHWVYEYDDIEYSTGNLYTEYLEYTGTYPAVDHAEGNDVDLIY